MDTFLLLWGSFFWPRGWSFVRHYLHYGRSEIGCHIFLSAYAFYPTLVCPTAHSITHFYFNLIVPLLHVYLLFNSFDLQSIQNLSYIYTSLLFCLLYLVLPICGPLFIFCIELQRLLSKHICLQSCFLKDLVSLLSA